MAAGSVPEEQRQACTPVSWLGGTAESDRNRKAADGGSGQLAGAAEGTEGRPIMAVEDQHQHLPTSQMELANAYSAAIFSLGVPVFRQHRRHNSLVLGP